MTSPRRRRPVTVAAGVVPLTVVTVVTAVTWTGTAPPAAAADGGRRITATSLPRIAPEAISRSIKPLSTPSTELRLTVLDVAETRRSGRSTTVTLRSDILFAFARSDLSAAARARIADLAAAIPQGVGVTIGGHTDSIGSPTANLTLSRDRARAVADAIRRSRPDLRLEVEGYGEARPVAPNRSGTRDNPEGRAKNRRVEIRYGD